MEINIIQEEDVCVIYLHGEMTYDTTQYYEEIIFSFISRLMRELPEDPPPILIDLYYINFLDSAGIGMLVGTHRECRHRLIEIGFSGLKMEINTLVERSNLNKMLSIFPTEIEGRKALIERQRLFQRHPYQTEGQFSLDEKVIPITLRNISKNGANFLSKEEIPLASQGDIIISDEQIVAKSEIKRCKVYGYEGYEVAVEFVSVDYDNILKILRIIEGLNN